MKTSRSLLSGRFPSSVLALQPAGLHCGDEDRLDGAPIQTRQRHRVFSSGKADLRWSLRNKHMCNKGKPQPLPTERESSPSVVTRSSHEPPGQCPAPTEPSRFPVELMGCVRGARHTHPGEGAVGYPVQAGGSVHESEAARCLCASMLATSWMFQGSAVRSSLESPGLILHSLSHAASPCHRDSASHRCSWDVVKQMQILNFLRGCFPLFPQRTDRQSRIRAVRHPSSSLSHWLLTIPVLKSCQLSALCFPLAFCCGVHLEWLGTLLETEQSGRRLLNRRYIQY